MTRKMILTDWRAMKYYHIRAVLLPIFVCMIALFSSHLLVMPTCVLLCMFFSINTFAVEEKGALNNLYLTLPVKRDSIVSGRFMLAIIMGIAGIIISVPIMLLVYNIGFTKYIIPLSWYIFILVMSYLLFAVLMLAVYPVLFKLGYAKGKFWGFILPAIFMGILYGAYLAISDLPGNEGLTLKILEYAYENMMLVSGGISVLATVLLGIAYILSKRIYVNRDF